MPNPVGRPTSYTEELGTRICERIALGESVRNICKEEGMPVISTVMKWLFDKDKKEFSEQYEKACNTRAEILFEELLEIADTPIEGVETTIKGETIEEKKGDMLGHRKLQVDTRKWYLSKVLPKKFGDKVDMTTNGNDLPAPILGNVSAHNSNKKDSEPQ